MGAARGESVGSPCISWFGVWFCWNKKKVNKLFFFWKRCLRANWFYQTKQFREEYLINFNFVQFRIETFESIYGYRAMIKSFNNYGQTVFICCILYFPFPLKLLISNISKYNLLSEEENCGNFFRQFFLSCQFKDSYSSTLNSVRFLGICLASFNDVIMTSQFTPTASKTLTVYQNVQRKRSNFTYGLVQGGSSDALLS